MKNNTFLKSIICAWKGIVTGFKQEKNFSIYVLHVLLTLPINLLLQFSLIELLIYMVTFLGAFSAECFNTAIEKICDMITKEYNENIKIIKDIASAGVLYWGFAFYITEIVLVVSKLV